MRDRSSSAETTTASSATHARHHGQHPGPGRGRFPRAPRWRPDGHTSRHRPSGAVATPSRGSPARTTRGTRPARRSPRRPGWRPARRSQRGRGTPVWPGPAPPSAFRCSHRRAWCTVLARFRLARLGARGRSVMGTRVSARRIALERRAGRQATEPFPGVTRKSRCEGSLTCGGAKGTRTPNPLLAKSPNRFRERVVEHTVGRCGVPDHAHFDPHCSTSLGYETWVGRPRLEGKRTDGCTDPRSWLIG